MFVSLSVSTAVVSPCSGSGGPRSLPWTHVNQAPRQVAQHPEAVHALSRPRLAYSPKREMTTRHTDLVGSCGVLQEYGTARKHIAGDWHGEFKRELHD